MQIIITTMHYSLHFISQPYHMPPAALNGFYNIYLKQVTGNNNLSITVTNDPLPRSLENEVNQNFMYNF